MTTKKDASSDSRLANLSQRDLTYLESIAALASGPRRVSRYGFSRWAAACAPRPAKSAPSSSTMLATLSDMDSQLKYVSGLLKAASKQLASAQRRIASLSASALRASLQAGQVVQIALPAVRPIPLLLARSKQSKARLRKSKRRTSAGKRHR